MAVNLRGTGVIGGCGGHAGGAVCGDRVRAAGEDVEGGVSMEPKDRKSDEYYRWWGEEIKEAVIAQRRHQDEVTNPLGATDTLLAGMSGQSLLLR